MRRVLFRLGPITVYSYTAMQYVGIVLGVFAQKYAATVAGLDPNRVLAATFILLVPALAGARFLHLLLHWREYRTQRRRVWDQSEGGAAMYGGLILIVPLSVPLLTVLNVPFAAYWDTASFTMLIGTIFGRIGCLLNGCCCGRPTTSRFALGLPDHKGAWRRRIPTQILEAVWGLILLAGLVWIWQLSPFRGATILYAVGGYSAGRFFLEGTREQQDWVVGFSVQRVLSVAFVAASLLVFVTLRPS